MSLETVASEAEYSGLEPLTLYTETEYYDQIRMRLAAAEPGDRAVIMTMGFDPTELKVATLMDEVHHAAARGVETYLGVDAYTFMLDDKNNRPGPMLTRGHLDGKMNSTFRERLDSLDRLDSYVAGHAGITNRPNRAFTNPIAGRSHIKGAVINNWYSIGGCNLIFSDKHDLMVGGEGTETADWMYQLMTDITMAESTQAVLGDKDIVHHVDQQTEIIVDAGVPNQSLILENAHRMIQNGDEWVLMSGQYFPGGQTGKYLANALARGAEANVIYNHPANNGTVGGLWQRATLLGERLLKPARLFADELPADAQPLHAKTLTTNRGGSVGSHNNIATGVKLGTPEITLFRHDPAFARNVAQTLLDHIGLIENSNFAHIMRNDTPEGDASAA